MSMWELVNVWLGVSLLESCDVISHFLTYRSLLEGNKFKRLNNLIWTTVLRCVWSMQNLVLFKGLVGNMPKLFNHIKYVFLGWFIGNVGRDVYFSFSSWWQQP